MLCSSWWKMLPAVVNGGDIRTWRNVYEKGNFQASQHPQFLFVFTFIALKVRAQKSKTPNKRGSHQNPDMENADWGMSKSKSK